MSVRLTRSRDRFSCEERPSILFIDDDADVLTETIRLLETFGFAAQGVVSGLKGIDAATDGDYDAIVIDLKLPNVSGLEVLRYLRPQPAGHKGVVHSSEAGQGGTPQTLLLDPQGKILKNWRGAYQGSLRKEVERVLALSLPGLDELPATSAQGRQ